VLAIVLTQTHNDTYKNGEVSS